MILQLARFYRDARDGLSRLAWLMAAVQLVNQSGTMVVFFLSLYLTRRLGFLENQAGQVGSAYGLGMLLGTITGGVLSDQLGAPGLMVNVIVLWNTFYMDAALSKLRLKGMK